MEYIVSNMSNMVEVNFLSRQYYRLNILGSDMPLVELL